MDIPVLAVAAFLAATVLPMSSEVALFGVLKLHPHLHWPAIAVATAVIPTRTVPSPISLNQM